MNEQEIEQEIQAKGLTALRVTPGQIDALMNGVGYHTHVVPGTTTTVATAIAANGFTLGTGVSACASLENFDEDLGCKIAIQNAEKAARDKLWELEGWRLKVGDEFICMVGVAPVGSFSWALMRLQAGAKVARRGWNGKGMWIRVNNPVSSPFSSDGNNEIEALPFFEMYTVNGEGRRAMLSGWLASQTDMLANDWEELE